MEGLFLITLFLTLTLPLTSSQQRLDATDYAVSIKLSMNRANKYELHFTCRTSLQHTQGFRLHVILYDDSEEEEAESQSKTKLTENNEWKWKYKNDAISPGQLISYQLEILQNNQWRSSNDHTGQVPQQENMEELVETTTASTTTGRTTTLRRVEITLKSSSSAPTIPPTVASSSSSSSPTEKTEDVKWEERSPHRRPPPPPPPHKGELDLTLIIVCTVVPIVVMAGIILIVCIVIRYRRSHPAFPPPPYELPGTLPYGVSTIGSDTSQGKLLQLPPKPVNSSIPVADENPYTYAGGDMYEEIRTNQEPQTFTPNSRPQLAAPSYSRTAPATESDSVYIDPEVGLPPDSFAPNPPTSTAPLRSPNYERPLPRQPGVADNRVYLALDREGSDAYEF